MDENAEAASGVRGGVGGEGPIRISGGLIADADVGAVAEAPMVDREEGLFGVVIVDLHGAVALGRLGRIVAEIVNLA